SASIRPWWAGRNSSLGLPIGHSRSWMSPLGARWMGSARFMRSALSVPSLVLMSTTKRFCTDKGSPAPGGGGGTPRRGHEALHERGADEPRPAAGAVEADVVQVDQADVGVRPELLLELELHRPVHPLVEDVGLADRPPDELRDRALARVAPGGRDD